jgi:hypothetical protein
MNARQFAALSVVAAACAAAITASCGLASEPYLCTASVEPAVIVEIRDARSGAPLAAEARGVVRDGAYVDSLRPAESSGVALYSRRAADERAGTYAIEVQRIGYQTWTASGISVGRGDCHVETRRVTASVVPSN